MEFLKAFRPLANWVLRLSLALELFLIHRNEVEALKFNQASFYLSALSILGVVLLILGGMFKNKAVTITAALLVLLLSLYETVTQSFGFTPALAGQFMTISIALYFLVNGNRNG